MWHYLLWPLWHCYFTCCDLCDISCCDLCDIAILLVSIARTATLYIFPIKFIYTVFKLGHDGRKPRPDYLASSTLYIEPFVISRRSIKLITVYNFILKAVLQSYTREVLIKYVMTLVCVCLNHLFTNCPAVTASHIIHSWNRERDLELPNIYDTYTLICREYRNVPNTTYTTSGAGLLTLPEHLNSPPVLVGLYCSIFSFLCSVLFYWSFFIWSLCCMFFFDLCTLIPSLVSSTSTYYQRMEIYIWNWKSSCLF